MFDQTRRTCNRAPIHIALLLPILGGCTSQQTIVEQTEPLRNRIEQVESAHAQLSRATKDESARVLLRDGATAQKIDDLQAEVKELREKLARLSARADALTESSKQNASRLEAQAAISREAGNEIEALRRQAAKSELRLDELDTLQREAEENIALLSERQTLTEQRQNESAAEARETQGRLDLMHERQTQTEMRLDEAMTQARDALDATRRETAK